MHLLKRFRDNQAGIAAIEAALILPLLLFLYFGLFDLTGLITVKRKLTYTTSAVADLVSQSNGTVTAAEIDDYFKAAELMMRPYPMSGVRVEIYNWRPTSTSGGVTSGTIAWKRKSTTGTSCGEPTDADVSSLLKNQNNDLVVAVMCTSYTPAIATFLGTRILGATQFALRDQITLRPRQSNQINCTNC